MGNIRRFSEGNLAYCVTTVTEGRTPIFSESKLCRILLVTIEYYKTVFDYQVYGYCLMPDHLHLILKPEDPFNLSFIMKMIKGSFSRKVNRLKGREGSLWQSRFYDEGIRTESQLLAQLDYVHENPVKAGLVSEPGRYVFSSFSQYHGLVNPEGDILKIDPFG